MLETSWGDSPPMSIGNKIKSGSEFDVYEYGTSEVLKIPRHRWLMKLIFGNFRQKNENDLQFLQAYFADFLPTTTIVDLGKRWAIRQQRVSGTPFFKNPRMTPSARSLLWRAAATYQESGSIPDILNPDNLAPGWRPSDQFNGYDNGLIEG